MANALSIQPLSFTKGLGIIRLPAKDRDEQDTGPAFSPPHPVGEVEAWSPQDLIDGQGPM